MRTHLRESLLRAAMHVIYRFDRRRPDTSRLGTESIRCILAVSTTAIGDTLLSTPALRSLRLAYPKARIDLLLNAKYSSLFSDNPDIDSIIPSLGSYRRFLRLAWQLRQARYDMVVILHGNEPQATPLAYLSGADFRFKLPNDNAFRFLLSNTDPVLRWDDFTHGIDQRLAVAYLAGGVRTDHGMTLAVPARTQALLEQRMERLGIDQGAELIGLQAGASTVSRRWPARCFAELGRRLLEARPRSWIVLTGSPGEKALTDEVAARIGSPRVWNAAGLLPLDELPALMRRLALLVTGDTGPMHMAVATGTPVVALFAVSDWRRSGPPAGVPDSRHFVIQKWRTCTPCLSKRCPYAEPPCMVNITVEEVESTVVACLDGAPGKVSDQRQATS